MGRRNDIVREALGDLTGTPSLQQKGHPKPPHAKTEGRDVAAAHLAEHADALQTMSSSSSPRNSPQAEVLQQEVCSLILREACVTGIQRAAKHSDSTTGVPAQQGQKARWIWAKPRPGSGCPGADSLPAPGHPVPRATQMSQQPADHCPDRLQLGSHACQEQHSSRRQGCGASPAADAFDAEPEAAEDAPAPAVIEALVLHRALAQYACTSRACLGWVVSPLIALLFYKLRNCTYHIGCNRYWIAVL